MMLSNLLSNLIGGSSQKSRYVFTATVFLAGCISTVVARTSATTSSSADSRDFAQYGVYLTAGTALLVQFLFADNNDPDESTYLPVNNDKTMTFREDRGKTLLVPLIPEKPTKNKAAKTKALKKYTMKQVAEKSTREELWVSIDGRVYDLTKFVDRHPGGPLVIENMAGKDCTDAFMNYHQARVSKTMLPPFLVGEVTDVPVYPHVQDFRALRQELLRKGMYHTEWKFYAKLSLFMATLLVTALYLSVMCETMASHMLGAALLGIFWQQLAGVGHDLGHSSVTRNFYSDHWIGSTVGCGLMGISTGWWKRNHNTHHVACNSVEHDPDIQHMPIMAVDEKVIEAPYWSTYYLKWVKLDVPARILVSYQHYLFIPLMMVARFNLYAQSWIMIFSRQNHMYNRKLEAASLLFYATWVIGVALQMNSWTESVLWFLVSHAIAGILHIQIVISHWCMETYSGHGYNDDTDEWYIQQFKTTMDIECPAWFDWAHVGLQFQVEHHLYPLVPRHNLRKVKAMVKEICKKHDIEYHSMTFLESVKANMANLKATAMAVRNRELTEEEKSMTIMNLLHASTVA
jgi:fatty acid desaturase